MNEKVNFNTSLIAQAKFRASLIEQVKFRASVTTNYTAAPYDGYLNDGVKSGTTCKTRVKTLVLLSYKVMY